MPKKQKPKSKRSKLPFAHPTKHGKLHWKKILYIVLFSVFGLVLAAAIMAQVFYNKFVNDQLQNASTFQIKVLVSDAIHGLLDLYTTPDAHNRIPEARLQLPPKTDKVSKLLYLYTPSSVYEDTDGTTHGESEYLQVTTKAMSNYGIGQLNGGLENMLTLFEHIPEAQACTRGFRIYFDPPPEDLSSDPYNTKKLADGRTLYLYHEDICKYYDIEAIQAYLLRAQSY